MKEQFCNYEISLKLKELGFDEEVIAMFDTYDKKELSIFAFSIPNKGIFEIGFKKGWAIKAPLWQQVEEWLRNKHNLFIYYRLFNNGTFNSTAKAYIFDIIRIDSKDKWTGNGFNTYEEARKQAILKAIELCQVKN